MQQFASDNTSPVCPEVIDSLTRANVGHVPAYGNDVYTQEACDLFRETFETDCDVYFVFNGTSANSLSVANYCQPYHSVICSQFAHIETDECGAPEFFSHGAKLLLAEAEHGKLSPEGISQLVTKRSDIHYAKPNLVSITQATEVGTIYNQEELRGIKEAVDKHNLKLHMDGARFANALAELKCSPREITHDVGVDVLCLGGSKNGLALGDAVVFFNKEDSEEFAYRCKQSGQLASKMRYISAQWLGALKNNVWMKNAQHANDAAAYLEERLSKFDEISILFPRQANSVFADLPKKVADYLRANGWGFYTFIGEGGARFMCSWDTKKEAIDALITAIDKALSQP